MIITSTTNNIPDWIQSIASSSLANDTTCQKESINATKPSSVNERVIDHERNRIDALASTKEKYIINSDWPTQYKEHLKEYASVVGVETIEKKVTEVIKQSSVKNRTVTANSLQKEFEVPVSKLHSQEHQTFVSQLKHAIDPFNIDGIMNEERPVADNWEKVSAAQQLNFKPSMDSKIIPIRGGEKQNIESKLSLAENQNSIDNPNKIKELLETKTLDGGERIKKSIEEKQQEKIANIKNWESDIVNSMTHKDLLPNKNIFMTESLYAQEGLDNQLTTLAGMSENEVPEHTAGELLKFKKQERAASIQRPKTEDNWEVFSKEATYSYDDMFINSLEQKLKGNK